MTETFFQNRWYRIYQSETVDTSVIAMRNAVMIVPLLDDGRVILTVEYSPAFNQWVYILSSGGIEAGEDPAHTANRELQEETGYKAGRLDKLGIFCPFIKYLNQTLTIYLARDLQPSRLQGDEGYEIGLEYTTLDDFETLIAAGRIQDCGVIAALYMARSFLERERRA
ncbi:MAG: NUDIX hydrolase [Chloroflexi bacterium]|nr:NUDIX hydrolase [Chloroflexota bacterium]